MARGLISGFMLNPLSGDSAVGVDVDNPMRRSRSGVISATVEERKKRQGEGVVRRSKTTAVATVASSLVNDELAINIARRVADTLGDTFRMDPRLQGVEILHSELERVVQQTLVDVLVGRSAVLHLGDDAIGEGAEKAALVRSFLEGLVRISANVEQEHQESAIEKLIEVYAPDPLEELRGVLAKDNLDLRLRFLHEVPCLTSAEVAHAAGHGSKNASATASRWKAKGEIFSIPFKNAELYPAFQFRDGEPHPTIKPTLAALPKRRPWQIAFWFVSTNGWLNDKAPVDVLDDTEAVVEAALHEGKEVVG